MFWENPVLGRELLTHLRSRRAFALQALFVAGLAAVVLLAWPRELRLEEAHSRRIFDTFALGQFVLLALLAPVLSAPSIAGEREGKTFDLLLTSPLSTGAILHGKLLGALVYLLLLAVSSLPLFAVCFLLGAVGPLEVLGTYAFLFTAGFFCGALGLAASAYMERSRGGLAVSYVAILPMVLILVLLRPVRSFPFMIVLSVLLFGGGSILLALVHGRIRRPFDNAPKAADEEKVDEQVGLVLDRKRFPDRILYSRGGGKPLDERANPLYEKELRHELFGRGALLVRILLQVSFVAALPFFIASLAAGRLWVYSYYVLGFVMLLAPSLTAGTFTQERERRTLDLLLTTTLDHGRILRAKLWVNLRNIAILGGFLLPFLPVLWILSRDVRQSMSPFFMTAGTLAVLGSTGLFAVLLTAFFSLVSRTTMRSMVYSYLTLGTLFILPVVAYKVLTDFAAMDFAAASWVGLPSPFFTLAAFERLGRSLNGINYLGIYIQPNAAPVQLAVYLVLTLGGSLLLAWAVRAYFPAYGRFHHERGL